MSDSGPPSSPTDSISYVSRRLRLIGFARTTRDTYIPKFTGSVTQIASGASRAFTPTNDLYDDQGKVILPKNSTITLFPSYTRQTSDDPRSYVVNVKGWLSCPGLMTRKNRLILSLAKQITKYGSSQAIEKLESDDLNTDAASIASSASSSSSLDRPPSTNNSTSRHDDLIKERLKAFIARSIAGAKLLVTVGSEEAINAAELQLIEIVTDANGHFELDIDVTYKPSVVQVRACDDETIFVFGDVMIIPNDGLGLISDIDDTIKLTGVIGDKRELMSNLLLNDVLQWNIPPVVNWYTNLFQEMNVSFHYVSNSPWQLFSLIESYFRAVKLPQGSIHLKQYTGNIISSLMEPSSSRKKRALCKILDDFPKKKFICVGDSGEHDLEAYAELARCYPHRIIAIYIRKVENSISDLDEEKILNEIKRIIKEDKRLKAFRIPSHPEPPKPEEVEDLIDLSDLKPVLTPAAAERQAKLPPMIPVKPKSIQGQKLPRKPPPVERSLESKLSPPPPPPRRSTTAKQNFATGPPAAPRRSTTTSPLQPTVTESTPRTSISSDETPPGTTSADSSPLPPPLPKRHTHIPGDYEQSDEADVYDNLQNVYHVNNIYELELMDRTGAQWLTRIVDALESMRNTNTELKFFSDGDEDLYRDVLRLTTKIVKKE